MHFEILVEDASGKILLEHIVPKVMGESVQQHSWRIHAYKGIGHLPRNLRGSTDPAKRVLLDRLPQLRRLPRVFQQADRWTLCLREASSPPEATTKELPEGEVKQIPQQLFDAFKLPL